MTWIIDAIRNAGPLPAYLIITALVFAEDALFIGFILPGETAAVLGGVLASQHHLQLWLILLLVIAAAIIGDTVGYQIGRHFGSRILQIPLLQKRRPQLDRARDLLARKGGSAVFLGRFTAFFRAVMPALAGLSHMPYRRFLAFNIAGGTIWGAAVVLAGYFAGNAYLTAAKTFGPTVTIALLAVLTAAAAAWYVRKRIKARTSQCPAAPPLQSETPSQPVSLETNQPEDPLQHHGRVSGHGAVADFAGGRVQCMAHDVDRVNIQTDESMLKHSRDLPNFTCGTTIPPPTSRRAKGAVNGNPRTSVKQKAPAPLTLLPNVTCRPG